MNHDEPIARGVSGGAEWKATSHQAPWNKVRTRKVNYPQMDPFMALFQIGQSMFKRKKSQIHGH